MTIPTLLLLLLVPVQMTWGQEPPPPPVENPEPPCPEGHTCVPDADMETFVQLLQERKCLDENTPKATADSVTVIVDKEGRVYGSGTGKHPFKVHLEWCHYKIEAESQVKLQVAQEVERTWGFRLRIKATFGFLIAEAFQDDTDELQDTLDGGFLVEPFFIDWANVNAYVGFRSIGAGLGVDLTTNFGLYAGYALTWGDWRHNPLVSVFFAF